MRKLQAAALILLVAGVTACSDQTQPVAPELEMEESEVAAHVLDALARSVAVELSNPANRAAFLEQLAASTLPQKQLLLEDFLATPLGSRVADRWVRQTGAANLISLASTLPTMSLLLPTVDAVVPGESGTLDVAAALNSDLGPWSVYAATGAMKDRRSGPSADVLGTVIIEPTVDPARLRSGRGGEAVRWITVDGDTIDIAGDALQSGQDIQFEPQSFAQSGSTTLSEVHYSFCDGVPQEGDEFPNPKGDIELRIEARFFHEDGRLGAYGEYYNGDVPEPSNCGTTGNLTNDPVLYPAVAILNHAIPSSGRHYIVVDVWEDDCDCFGDSDDHYGSALIGISRNGDLIEASSQASVKLSWNAPAASELTSLEFGGPGEINTVAGNSATRAWVRFLDQYGYGLAHSVTQWTSSNTWVATVSANGAREALVYPNSAGTAIITASGLGLSDQLPVYVQGCDTGTGTCPESITPPVGASGR